MGFRDNLGWEMGLRCLLHDPSSISRFKMKRVDCKHLGLAEEDLASRPFNLKTPLKCFFKVYMVHTFCMTKSVGLTRV